MCRPTWSMKLNEAAAPATTKPRATACETRGNPLFSALCSKVNLNKKRLKAAEARQGTSLKNVIHTAMEFEIRKAQADSGTRVKFPVLPSREPGALHLTTCGIEC